MLNNLIDRLTARQRMVACLLWLVLFILYFPAARAGFVADTTGWVESVQRDGFWDYINRTHFKVKSMYQLTQLTTWIIYQLIGCSKWGWHIVHLTLHALNAFLLFVFCRRLFFHSGIENPARPAFIGSLLFAISPYVSEVVVWEASFHYLQALVLMFSILILAQRFQERPSFKTALAAGVLFFLSTFSLELFYLTPALVFTLALFYRTALHYDKAIFRKTLLFFTLPQGLFFLLHLLLFRMVYGTGVAHIGNLIFEKPLPTFLVKTPWYFFHLLAWGRFLPHELRVWCYDLFRTPAGAILFYTVIVGLCAFITFRYRKFTVYGKVLSLFFIWLLIAVSILTPLFFPELFWVICDRYMYLLLAFYWMLITLIFYRIRSGYIRYACFILFGCINLYFTIKLSVKWKESEEIIDSIQNSKVLMPGKVKLLLNSPACFKGIPMIGTSPEGEYRLMHNLFFTPPINDTMLEVAAYNMTWKTDGAHAEVINDSTVKVTLNQWGTWWWLGAIGASGYENEWFRLDLQDPGHWYNLILKKPSSEYQLLYQTGYELKAVDMKRKGEQY